MVHVQTGNKLDVVYTYEDDRQVLKGIQPWDGDLIPLRDPDALVDVLIAVMAECARYNKKSTK